MNKNFILAPALALALASAAPARADEGRRSPAVPLLPKYQQECSACHLAYPPALLGAASWQRITATLDRHYGSDASLDAATVAQLNRWLVAHAGSGRRAAAPPEDRITRSAWFQHEHDEIAAAVWRRASIRSPANCAACHTRAEQGDFNEHSIRIPR